MDWEAATAVTVMHSAPAPAVFYQAEVRATGSGPIFPANPRTSGERALFDQAQEGDEKGSPAVRKVSENANWHHSSFSTLWYDLWYEFHN